MDIDWDSPEPLYRQLAARLREAIERGEYTARIPSEPSLAQQTGLARQTVRKAVRLLAEEGLVTRVPGKGTYVSK